MMRRREFIAGLGGAAAAWPLAARAQLRALPVIGFLSAQSADDDKIVVSEFLESLKESGFTDGRNVAVEYRHADNHFDRLPALAADLVRHRVAVLIAIGQNAAHVAKSATATIHQLAPRVTTVAVLLDGGRGVPLPDQDFILKEAEAARRTVNIRIIRVTAGSEGEFDAAFATAIRDGASALLVSASGLFLNHRDQLVALAARHKLPATYQQREYVEAGGLMSYGPSLPEAYREVGVYTGRVLKGEKPTDLPMTLPTKFEFVLNLKTAKALNIEIPPGVLAIADAVIE